MPKMLTDEMDASAAVAHILRDATSPHVVVGPVVWRPSDGTSSKQHYFTVVAGGADDFHIDQIFVPGDDAPSYVEEVLGCLALSRPARVIHLVGSELAAAELVEHLWPGDRSSKLRAAVEAESGGA